jgi:hypothetical protein
MKTRQGCLPRGCLPHTSDPGGLAARWYGGPLLSGNMGHHNTQLWNLAKPGEE